MAAGKPIVASALPGVRRVVEDGVDGFLAPPGDAAALAGALTRLVEDRDLRERFGRAGRAKVEERYDWRKLAARIEAEYDAVLAERDRR